MVILVQNQVMYKRLYNMQKIIKIGLAILMFGCLLKMPYGYYQLVRFVALVGFGVLAYLSYNQKQEMATLVYIVLALLFQPFFKVAIGRELWNLIDLLVGIGLVISVLNPKRMK